MRLGVLLVLLLIVVVGWHEKSVPVVHGYYGWGRALGFLAFALLCFCWASSWRQGVSYHLCAVIRGIGKEGKGQGAGKASAGRGVGLLASCILGLGWSGPVRSEIITS